MNIAESHRQYQLVLEHDRALRDRLGDLYSVHDELEESAEDVRRAYAEVIRCWVGE